MRRHTPCLLVVILTLVAMLYAQLLPVATGHDRTNETDHLTVSDNPESACSKSPASKRSCDADQDHFFCSSFCVALPPSELARLTTTQETASAAAIVRISTMRIRPPHPPPKD